MYTFINIGNAEIIILFIAFIFLMLPLALTIICLIDLFKRDFSTKTTDRLLIILLIACLPILGPLIYLLGLKKDYPLKEKAAL